MGISDSDSGDRKNTSNDQAGKGASEIHVKAQRAIGQAIHKKYPWLLAAIIEGMSYDELVSYVWDWKLQGIEIF